MEVDNPNTTQHPNNKQPKMLTNTAIATQQPAIEKEPLWWRYWTTWLVAVQDHKQCCSTPPSPPYTQPANLSKRIRIAYSTRNSNCDEKHWQCKWGVIDFPLFKMNSVSFEEGNFDSTFLRLIKGKKEYIGLSDFSKNIGCHLHYKLMYCGRDDEENIFKIKHFIGVRSIQ